MTKTKQDAFDEAMTEAQEQEWQEEAAERKWEPKQVVLDEDKELLKYVLEQERAWRHREQRLEAQRREYERNAREALRRGHERNAREGKLHK